MHAVVCVLVHHIYTTHNNNIIINVRTYILYV